MSSPPPHNFRANWVSSALTVLLFLSFAFVASAHDWSDTSWTSQGEHSTNVYLFEGQDVDDLGEAVSTARLLSIPRDRVENDARLYGLAQANGRGSHGASEEVPFLDWRGYGIDGAMRRWSVDSEAWVSAGVWFDDDVWGEAVDREVRLRYMMLGVMAAGKWKWKEDKSETVTMRRRKVFYDDENGMRTFRWETSESRWLSDWVSRSGHTYYDPYDHDMGTHFGIGFVYVRGLTTGDLGAAYHSPAP